MIPRIFISSTVRDLQYLREALRDAVQDLEYVPVLSEFGGVGYSPWASAIDSCYTELKTCDLAIFVLGKRYGTIDSNGLSVTHNEFRAAVESLVPCICLVDAEVLSARSIYEENERSDNLRVPGMDNPSSSFAFLSEIESRATGNAILPFHEAAGARRQLKLQLAHLFGDFLARRRDPLRGEVNDILSELKVLRRELRPSSSEEMKKFGKALRYLLDEPRRQFREIVETLAGSLEDATAQLLTSSNFAGFVHTCSGAPPHLVEPDTEADVLALRGGAEHEPGSFRRAAWTMAPYGPKELQSKRKITSFWAIDKDTGRFIWNPQARRWLEDSFVRFRNIAEGRDELFGTGAIGA